jgi:lysozyme
MKKRILWLGLLFGLMAAGCSAAGEDQKSGAESLSAVNTSTAAGWAEETSAAEKETEPFVYTFVDVYGESYEAPLLDSVPANIYDYTRIKEIGGFKYYTDEAGAPLSRLGVDVSKYQADVDWQAVKDAGVDFVIIRCGFRGYGESGVLKEDERFREHLAGAQAAGLETGVYFFSQAVSEAEAVEEADFVLSLIEGQGVAGPVVYDTEEIKDDTARTDDLTPAQFTDHSLAFCGRIREAGYEPMIYANMKWLAFTMELERLNEYEIWYADYEPVPQSPYRIRMWQYTEEGQVPGIEGNADINVWFPKEP